MKIIPAIDIRHGKVVRLSEGDYTQQTTYAQSLSEMLSAYVEHDLLDVHIIDLDAAKGEESNLPIIQTAIQDKAPNVQLGGGVRSIEKALALLQAGIIRVIVGTQAIVDAAFLPELKAAVLQNNYTLSQIVIAIDVKDEVIKYGGWLEASPIKLTDYITSCMALGFTRFLCTDIAKDGKLQGPSIDLYAKIKQQFPNIQLIASGGISSLEDVAALTQIGIPEGVVGKAIYENKISLPEIRQWNLNNK